MSKAFLSEVNQKEDKANESFKAEKFEAIKPDRTKYLILAGIVVVALVASFFLLNTKVTVENLVGMQIGDAKTWALNNDVQIVQTEVYAATQEGLILSQSVAASDQVKPKSTIAVEVSLGYDPEEVITLPSFDESWTKTKVVAWLDENHIDNFTLLFEEDENAEPNLYISHNLPETSSNYVRSDAIEFTFTILPVEAEIVMVDMINYSTAQIDAWSKDNELKVRYITAYSETVAENKVLTQSIASTEIVNPGDTITITLSSGPAIKILDFTGVSEADAVAWAKEVGVDLTTYHEYSSSVALNGVIWQDVAKDTIVKTGTDLKLFYSLGSQITLATYVNQSLTNLQAYVDAQNVLRANLVVNVEYSYSSSIVVNKIISQSVADTKVGIGTVINVMVSLGDLSTVPNVLNGGTAYSSALAAYDAVMSACTSADVVCQIIFSDNDAQIGVVASQSVTAGTQVSDSTVVEVVIYD